MRGVESVQNSKSLMLLLRLDEIPTPDPEPPNIKPMPVDKPLFSEPLFVPADER
jgi:hypothetical protein